MMTDRDTEIFKASRDFSDKMDSRMAFIAGSRWADKHPDCVSIAYLQCWYQDSIDNTKPPIWTDKHIDELFHDFYLIPKGGEE